MRGCANPCTADSHAGTKEARHGKVIYPVLTQEFLTEVLKHGNNEQFSQTHRSSTVNHNNPQVAAHVC